MGFFDKEERDKDLTWAYASAFIIGMTGLLILFLSK